MNVSALGLSLHDETLNGTTVKQETAVGASGGDIAGTTDTAVDSPYEASGEFLTIASLL